MKSKQHIIVVLLQLAVMVSGKVVKRSDDLSLQALQVLVQQQASALSTLQASLSELRNAQSVMHNDIAGLKSQVGMPVAFTARFSADDEYNGIPLNPHETLRFDSVLTNAGNGYSAATGLFTAPTPGYYAFFIVMMEPLNTAHPSVSLSIVKQGVVLDKAWAPDNADSDEQGSTQTVVHLAAGEQVWIRQEVGNAVRGGYWTVFTGYLVHAG